jgi:hypothetical protein
MCVSSQLWGDGSYYMPYKEKWTLLPLKDSQCLQEEDFILYSRETRGIPEV